MTDLVITKMDVLDDFEEIKICTHYELDGVKTDTFPLETEELDRVVPVYKTFEGWMESTTDVSTFDELPAKDKEYLNFIEQETAVPSTIVSNGQTRSETHVLCFLKKS